MYQINKQIHSDKKINTDENIAWGKVEGAVE